jgi:hypothetical protein
MTNAASNAIGNTVNEMAKEIVVIFIVMRAVSRRRTILARAFEGPDGVCRRPGEARRQ